MSKIPDFERGKANILPPRTIFLTYGAGVNTWSILRIKLKLHCVQNVEPDIPPIAGGSRGRFTYVSI